MTLEEELKLAEQLLDVWAEYHHSYWRSFSFSAACEQFELTETRGRELIKLLIDHSTLEPIFKGKR